MTESLSCLFLYQ